MSRGLLLDAIGNRIALDRDEGDIAYFNALALQLEYLTKLCTACILACVSSDTDRQRYGIEHRLVRADSLGEWVDALNATLTGPTAQCFLPAATPIARQLTERVGDNDWRHAVVRDLQLVARHFGLEPQVGAKIAIRQFFELGAAIRNRTRGHGATTSHDCRAICPTLASALSRVEAELEVFKLPWAHLHRNLNGKFRVSPLLGNCGEFDYLKRTRDVVLPDGVFVYLDRPILVPLVYCASDVSDVLVPNGNFKSSSFEVLSYVTNEVARKDGSSWSAPPGRLPTSETEGRTVLEQLGNTFANLPPKPIGYVSRVALEAKLQEELCTGERHPIISLTGPGGIGKTTLAIAAIESIASLESCPYEVVVWLSARDIDLLDIGPKPVAPRVVRKHEIARAVVELLEPSERSDAAFKHEAWFERCLALGAAGRTLFVLDNFETVESPADVFSWLDTHVRLPNKVLITTRFRDFVGDYPIQIGGMTDEEALHLISQHSVRLGIDSLIGPSYKDELIRESDGHPYVIKMLLGQVAKERRAVAPERIVASADQLLAALFERTYNKLNPASQRIFLLLSSWRVFVPVVAVEAVSLRPGNERFDVAGAIDELQRFSLIEAVGSDADNQLFIGVPLAAATYGRRKLDASPFKVAVEEDRKLLVEFGAGRREDAHQGVLPRINRLMQAVARKASANRDALESFVPILEYVASQVPQAYKLLADLVVEIDGARPSLDRAKDYLQRFLERAEAHEKLESWLQLADLCRSTDDAVGEVHALSEAALLPTVGPEALGALANRINNRIWELKGRQVQDVSSPEVRLLIERVAGAMEKQINKLSGTDCSRLAWLYLNVGNTVRAKSIASIGLQRDPDNEHCSRLMQRLSS